MSKQTAVETSRLADPPDDFSEWWYPYGRDPESGAHIGGHPDSERVWARKDPGRWVRRTYGVTARRAWNTQHYRSEFLSWIELGRPHRQAFTSLAASNQRQMQFYRDFMPLYQWCFVGQSIPPQENERLVEMLNKKYSGRDQ